MKSDNKKEFRYLVQIHFIENYNHLARVWDINEPVKSLKEATQYKSMIDYTVDSARVVDTVTDKVVRIWK